MTVNGTRQLTIPLPRTCPFAPPVEYTALREQGPACRVTLPSGATAWALTRHEEIRAMLADPRFSSDRTHPNFPMLIGVRLPDDNGFRPSLISMDPPDHGPARRAVVGEFTVRRLNALRPQIQQIVDEHLDVMLAGPRPADLVQVLSLPVPSLVICELLGVPYADHDFFQSCSATLLHRGLPIEDRLRSLEDLRRYLDELIGEKERHPTDDLLGRQLTRRRDDGSYRHEALVSLALLLLIAGHETTANMISLGTLMLLEHPAELAIIRHEPGKITGAVEELLRYFTIAETAASRVATADIEIAGVLIKAGEAVVGLAHAANRDPAAFAQPDNFDIERTARHHLSFGFGAHQCLGQNLARVELEVALSTLFRRIPGLRLATGLDELPFKDDAAVYGLYRLPVTW